MKVLFAFITVFICIFALSASAITPVDPWSSLQVTNSYSNNPITEDLSDMKVARAIGVENNPFYYSLETLTFEERKNAHIDIEFMLPVSKSIEMFASEIENKWNSGYFDEALALLAELDEMEEVKGNALIGISWRTPIPAPAPDWGNDVQISTRDSVFVLAMDHDNGSDNLFAMIGFTGDGMGSKYTGNFSSNGGYTWVETYSLGGFSYVMNDLDACCVANHFYVAYSGGGVANSMAWLKRFHIATGQPDTMPNGNSTFNIFNTTEIMDIDVSSNHEQFNNRLYFYCIDDAGTIHNFWNDPANVTWTGIATNINDAQQGLDTDWNLNYTNHSSILSYINNADQVKIYGRDGNTWDLLTTYGILNTPFDDFTTGIGGYGDTLFCAFSYDGAYMQVRYLVQYGVGSSWYYGFLVPDTLESNWTPDVTLRGGGGTHGVYRGPSTSAGYYRYRGYSGSWSTPEQFNDHSMSGEVKSQIEYVGSSAYGILYRTPIYNNGICYFDRSDWTSVSESPGITPASSFVKLYPNITKGKAHLSYAITKPGNVRLELYDVTGRLVKTLFNGYRREGDYRIEVNASSVTPGVYFMKINTPDGGFTERLTILK